MQQDEFTTVVHKRNRKVNTTTKQSTTFSYSQSTNKKITKGKNTKKEDHRANFNLVRSRIQGCSFYTNLCTITKQYIDNSTDVICYGIGHFLSNKQSLHQLVLLDLICTFLQIDGTRSIFDPVITSEEIEFATSIGFTILTENEEGKRKVNKKTFFYMPHCTKPLYSNVLWANWSPSGLSNVFILGNSFAHYHQRMLQKSNNAKYDYVDKITSHTTEVVLKGESPMEEAFNDLNLHFFEGDNLKKSPELWKESAEPPPFADDDPELIGVNHIPLSN